VALTRKFVDSEGRHWQVYELSNDGAVEPSRPESWLYFFSRDNTRSLSAYPDDWSVMDWRGLEGLCRHARTPVQRRPTRVPAVAHTIDA
jgi:hypothetical protein